MLDVGSSELLLIVIVAIVVIGPKDLPRVLYKLGQIIGKGRAMTRHFRAGIDEMIRHAELEEMEKKWAADNARIMAQTQEAAPVAPSDGSPALPAPGEADEAERSAQPYAIEPSPAVEPVAEEAPAVSHPEHRPPHQDGSSS